MSERTLLLGFDLGEEKSQMAVYDREKNIPEINSRYSVVIAAAKRARSLIDGDYPTVPVKGSRRVLSIAVEEMKEEKIGILTKEAAKETATVGYDDMSVVDFSAGIEEDE